MATKQNRELALQKDLVDTQLSEKTPVVTSSTENTTALSGSELISQSCVTVGIYKLDPEAEEPEYATDGSMCFDIKACLTNNTGNVTGYNKINEKFSRPVVMWSDHEDSKLGVGIDPGDRVLIPTGLIFDLHPGTALLLYPRSGISLKRGVKLANCIGVIDSDYVEQTFVILENTSNTRVYILHGDRICQGEIVKTSPRVRFTNLFSRPAQKTNRNGGFGSTGN